MDKDKGLKRLIPYLKRYKSYLYFGFLFVTLSNICSTLIPRLVGQTVDYIKAEGFTIPSVMENLGLILLLTVGSGFFMFLTRRTIVYSARFIEYDLRNDLILSIQSQDMDYFNRNSAGSLMAHATNDIPAAREFIGPALMYAANTLTTFTLVLYFMLTISPSLTLWAMLPLPLIALTTYLIGRKVHSAFSKVQEQFGELTTFSQETFSGIRVIRAYVRELSEQRKFNAISEDYLKKYIRLSRIQSLTMPLVMVFVGLSQVIVIGVGGMQIINGTITLGDLTQFFIYINLLIWPAAAIGWITNVVQRASASVKRLGNLLDQKPTIKDRSKSGGKDPDNLKGELRFKDVSLNYKKTGNFALKDINFRVPKGASLGITGTVGSGKTSIIKLLPRLYDPTIGEIEVDGRNIKNMSLHTLRTNIGIVTQEPFLFSTSIKENIRFGKPDATDEEVIKYAKIAQLHDDITHFPEQYETMLGERGITLSGGQKQRVAIARALIKEPDILILDDALSAVDNNTESKILHELKSIMDDRTTIIISHRISSISGADHIIFLENGKILEEGTHDQLLELKGKYNQMYDRQKLEQEIEKL